MRLKWHPGKWRGNNNKYRPDPRGGGEGEGFNVTKSFKSMWVAIVHVCTTFYGSSFVASPLLPVSFGMRRLKFLLRVEFFPISALIILGRRADRKHEIKF